MEQRAADKLQALRHELTELFVERDEFIDGALAALLSRQHVLLIGPPGSGSAAYPSSIDIPRLRSSGSRSVFLPVSTEIKAVLP